MSRRSGIIASSVLHAAVIAATSVYWVPSLAFPDEAPSVIPVELVSQIAEQTNIAPTIQKDLAPPAAKPLAEIAPPQMQVSAAPPPAAVEVEEPPPPEPEPAPEPPKPPPPEVAKEPPPKPAPTAEVPPASAEPQKLANLVLPRRKPTPPPKPKFDVDSVIRLLDKRTTKPAPASAPLLARPDETTRKGFGAQNALTVDLKDALLSQMRACWNVPVGAPNPEKLIVEVRVFLSQNGSLARPPELEPSTRAAMSANPYIRTAAEAALRAINVCEPYQHLPTDKYESWREIVMIFDPSKMIGR